MFQVIIITLPYFISEEAQKIMRLLSSHRAHRIHIRKPEASAHEVEQLLRSIEPQYYPQLVLHDHYSLAEKYRLGGVHLNSRNCIPPANWQGTISRSCHTLAEAEQWKELCHYVSLSPIFNSISKAGYRSAFSAETLHEAHLSGIIDAKVYALGGVTFAQLDKVQEMGFGGAMILGDAWSEK